jgi:transcriptional regulator with XRE-family HTH domain
MGLGERIRKLRKRLDLTQKEFAGRVVGKVDYTYIGRMERGEQYPSLKMLERIGKAFSVPLSYFFEDDSILDSLNLLPGEVKDLLKDRRRQNLLKISQALNAQDLGLVMQIINILAERMPRKNWQLAEPPLEYLSINEEKRKDLIGKIESALGSSPKGLSRQEDWLREALQIALQVLQGSAG